jgi:hypothetical protein
MVCSTMNGSGAMLQAGRSWVRVPMKSLNFFNVLNCSGCTRLWGLLSV